MFDNLVLGPNKNNVVFLVTLPTRPYKIGARPKYLKKKIFIYLINYSIMKIL